jgi:hypothetical protein
MKKWFVENSFWFYFIFCAVAILFIYENKRPASRLSTTNKNFNAELLFEVDGCKVYRFFDGGEAVYFTKDTLSNSSKIINVQTK